MRSGFTLVELSIVLVIIGLLIGGILVAQSLTDSAKVNQAVSQIQQYDVAVSNFQDRFKQLPGDSDKMTPAGNNDGDLADTVPGGPADCFASPCFERHTFWKHLSDVGILEKQYIFAHSGIDDATPIFFESYLEADYSTTANTQITSGWHYSSDHVISYYDSLSLDKKLDNNSLSTGLVRFQGITGGMIPLLTDCTDAVEICSIRSTIMNSNGQPLNN